MRMAFMGTPPPSVPTLAALAALADVALVVTRPDRPRGRSRRPQPSPVKEVALELGLPVAEPTRSSELVGILEEAGPFDVGVVVAFGMILPETVLQMAPSGFLNVHFSELPRWRGAAPVPRAIMAGDTTTGVTIMEMDTGLDTGPVVAAEQVEIGPTETGGELTARLAELGADLLVRVLEPWVGGELTSRPQDEAGATYAEKLEAADRLVTSAMTPREFVDRTRALAPQPGAQLEIDGRPHKVLAASATGSSVDPGRLVSEAGWPRYGVADGAVTLQVIQPPGGRPMAGDAWLRGHPRRTS